MGFAYCRWTREVLVCVACQSVLWVRKLIYLKEPLFCEERYESFIDMTCYSANIASKLIAWQVLITQNQSACLHYSVSQCWKLVTHHCGVFKLPVSIATDLLLYGADFPRSDLFSPSPDSAVSIGTLQNLCLQTWPWTITFTKLSSCRRMPGESKNSLITFGG